LNRCQAAFVETVIEREFRIIELERETKRRKYSPRPGSPLLFDIVLTVIVCLGKEVRLFVLDICALKYVEDLIDVQFAKSSSSSERSDIVRYLEDELSQSQRLV